MAPILPLQTALTFTFWLELWACTWDPGLKPFEDLLFEMS